jgi:RND family efflux transporter MFP subunit
MKTRERRLDTIFICFLLLAPLGCKRGNSGPAKDAPTAVQVARLEPRSIARVLGYDGDVQGELEVKVFAQVAERILSLPVEEGDTVKQGQLLAVLRADTLSEGVRSAVAAVDAARAERDNLKDEVKRTEALAAKNIVSRSQVDQLRARLLAAEAQIRRLEAMASQASATRGYAVVRAPIAGVVGRRFLSLGDLAAPALPILTVVRMDRVHLMLDVPEQDLALIRDRMTARLTVSRYSDRAFVGKVVLIGPTIDRLTRTARVKVELENRDHKLMPGMLARVDLEVERHDNVVVVPYSSVIIETGTGGQIAYRAFVVVGGKAEERTLGLGIIDGPRVEAVSGLQFGDTLITQGQQTLEKSRPVNVVDRVDLEGRKQGNRSELEANAEGKTAAHGEGGRP